MGIKYIDAKRLRRVLIGGGKWIQKHENYLNELNVYPVPDGDTGTNMSLTAKTMITEIENKTNDKSSMQDIKDIVSDAVLLGARGNSGTILSQIITGFLNGIDDDKKRLYPNDVAKALESAKELAYKAVDTPVEGTILTVIRMISERANELCSNNEVEYFNEFIENIIEQAQKAVELTPELLPKLKEAGVVDSGGQGLYYFFVGMGKILTEIELLTQTMIIENEFDKTVLNIDHNLGEIKYKYCTEFIILNSSFDIEEFKESLLEIGDLAVFATTSKKFKVHIHTNNPGLVLEKASSKGDLEKIKIENMKLQNEGVLENEKDRAKMFENKNKDNDKKDIYLILADTLELKDEFLKMGADYVLLGGQGQNPSVNDILSVVEKIEDNKTIYILPNNKNVISTANLATEKTDKLAVVVPTRTMLDGMFYLQYPHDSIEKKHIMNSHNYSVEVTKAVRNTTVDNMSIEVGDYMALVNTKIKYVSKDINELFDKIIDELITDNTLALTLVQGINKHNQIVERIVDLNHMFKENTKVIDTKQENYDFYLFIENKDPKLPKIAIITDSSCELDEKDIENRNISILPVRMEANGAHYKSGVNLSNAQFWDMTLNEKTVFKTAQPSPKEIINLYNELFRKGYEKILFIGISSKLSGTLQVAKLARGMNKREKDIEIYDSNAVSILLGYMVLEASNRTMKNESIENITRVLNSICEKSKMLIVVDDLKYLQQGGRISKTAQTIGDFLSMKPIITLSSGSLVSEKKVLGGEGQAIKYIEKVIAEKSKQQSIYFMGAVGGSSHQEEQMNKILESIKFNKKVNVFWPNKQIGPTVGTHAGPVIGVLLVPRLL